MSDKSRILKDYYKDKFKLGAACEHIHDRFTNNEIGNNGKEALILKHFDSITFANELKPAYNMGFSSPDAKEDFLPFVISQGAKTMLDFAKRNGIKVRGHVMVWHSQCPKEIFCKGYEPVTFPTDPELLKEKPFLKYFEKLNPICYTDRMTLLKRLKTYIYSLIEYMYANGYGELIYAWDVVNEAIELEDKQETGLRNTYWYQIIGDDFIYYAFLYAHSAVDNLARKYAKAYGIDSNDEEALERIKPVLFYNDYNEFMPSKRDAIIAMLNRKSSDHGSILSENLIGGIGMQGHLSDNNDIDEYKQAVLMYSKLVDEIHVTELDVKSTCTNINSEYYQAVFYKKFFEMLLDANTKGGHVTCVTFWGLTDDNSWIHGANPLLFHGDLSAKKAFDGVIYAITGESLGEPEPVKYDISDRHITFNNETDVEKVGFKLRGFGSLIMLQGAGRNGGLALTTPEKFDLWTGIKYDISDFLGQRVHISTYVKSNALSVTLSIGFGGAQTISVDTKNNGWVLLEGDFDLPGDVHSLSLDFSTVEEEAGKFNTVLIDEFNVSLLGQFESFEHETHTALVRGVGHLPVLLVTDGQSHTPGEHSLQVTRHEKDATVKFGISQYIGHKVRVTAFVKTADKVIRMGLDGSIPRVLTEEVSQNNWTKISFESEIPDNINSQEIFIETNGSSDFYVDDLSVIRID